MLPRLRAKRYDAVTLPRSDLPTISWIRMIEALLARPMPNPTIMDPRPHDDGRTLLVLDNENKRARRNQQQAADTQYRAHAEALEADAHADSRADRPSQHHRGESETADQRRFLHHPCTNTGSAGW